MEYYSSYVGIIIPMLPFEITFKSNWYLSTGVSPVERNLRVHFLGESKNRLNFCDLWSYGFFTPKKTEDPKKGSFTMTTACPRTPRGRKKQQTDPHGEDKKKKQHKLGTNIRNVYILVWNTNVFWIEYTP